MTATLTVPPRPADPPLPALLPAVRRREHLKRSERIATIALSATLSAVMESDDRAQSEDSLARHGLGVRQAWDEAAQQLIAAAQTIHGTRFWTRPVHGGGLQVRTDAAPASGWLAHPRPFRLLNEHLSALLSTPQPVYLLPDNHTLLAFPDLPPPPDSPAERRSWLSPRPLVWQRGFPAEAH